MAWDPSRRAGLQVVWANMAPAGLMAAPLLPQTKWDWGGLADVPGGQPRPEGRHYRRGPPREAAGPSAAGAGPGSAPLYPHLHPAPREPG